MTHSAEALEIQPYFDLELFMSVSGETRLGGALAERLMPLWEEWLSKAHALRVTTAGGEYLAVWLDEQVEEHVDTAWEHSPSDAFYHNALAQVLCMSAVHGILPEIEEAGCAPSPQAGEDLRAALSAEGLPYSSAGTPARRYAVVTPYPFQGGCELCSLQHACPKAQGGDNAASVLLPGHERGNG